MAKHKRNYLAILVRRVFSIIPNDAVYLRLLYFAEMRKVLHLKDPKSFTEKLQWLKVHNRKPVFTQMVDKYAAKDYVKERIGEKYVIPTLGVWNSAKEIEWEKLPNQFVLKSTNGGGGGGVIICKDKSDLNKECAIAKLDKSMKGSIYKAYREWPYKDVPKRIIAEKYISSDSLNDSEELYDYKFFCFNGVVKFFKVDFGRFVEHHANYYSPEGELLPFGEAAFPPLTEKSLSLPTNLNEMIQLAEKLSSGHPFLRVDLYNQDGKIYFGEMTFYPAGGVGKFISDEWDGIIGDYLNLDSIS